MSKLHVKLIFKTNWRQEWTNSVIRGLCLARIHRPALLTLENVPKFAEHPDYPVVCEIIHWCGCKIALSGIFEAGDRLPIKRARWLAILVRLEDEVPEQKTKMDRLGAIPTYIPDLMGCLGALPCTRHFKPCIASADLCIVLESKIVGQIGAAISKKKHEGISHHRHALQSTNCDGLLWGAPHVAR